MKNTFLLIVAMAVISFSCKKDKTGYSSFSEARYLLTVTDKWSMPGFTVPPGAHFTTFIGMVHNSNSFLWRENTMAGYGTEVLAETGGGGPILAEIDSMIAAKNAFSLLLFAAPSVSGTVKVNFNCNSNFSKVSFASMLGPTPDWFTGLSEFDLYTNNSWIADTTINLYVYDAGTEDGDVFGYNNSATLPQGNINLLQANLATVLANNNSTLSPIITARFTRQ